MLRFKHVDSEAISHGYLNSCAIDSGLECLIVARRPLVRRAKAIVAATLVEIGQTGVDCIRDCHEQESLIVRHYNDEVGAFKAEWKRRTDLVAIEAGKAGMAFIYATR
jgi:hypothetical protein